MIVNPLLKSEIMFNEVVMCVPMICVIFSNDSYYEASVMLEIKIL